jgi:hypothetical protein
MPVPEYIPVRFADGSSENEKPVFIPESPEGPSKQWGIVQRKASCCGLNNRLKGRVQWLGSGYTPVSEKDKRVRRMSYSVVIKLYILSLGAEMVESCYVAFYTIKMIKKGYVLLAIKSTIKCSNRPIYCHFLSHYCLEDRRWLRLRITIAQFGASWLNIIRYSIAV